MNFICFFVVFFTKIIVFGVLNLDKQVLYNDSRALFLNELRNQAKAWLFG